MIYDTSFLVGKGHSVKKFMMALRISSQPRPGFVESLLARITGKGMLANQAVIHKPEDLFVVSETIPNEVIKEVEKEPANQQDARKLVADLVADGAVRVDLIMDTVVGDEIGGPGAEPQEDADDTDERIVRYAGRLVAPETRDNFDLALVATKDDKLLPRLVEVAKCGLNVHGVMFEDLAGARALCDRLAELVNSTSVDKVVIES